MNNIKFIKVTLHQQTNAGFPKANKIAEVLFPVEAIAALRKSKENYYEVYLKSEYKIQINFDYDTIYASISDSNILVL